MSNLNKEPDVEKENVPSQVEVEENDDVEEDDVVVSGQKCPPLVLLVL
jgi:hypothetical protein